MPEATARRAEPTRQTALDSPSLAPTAAPSSTPTDTSRWLQVPPEARASVRALASRPEFLYEEFLSLTEPLPPTVRVVLAHELRHLTYVPPEVETARDRGLDPGIYKCGRGRERTMLADGGVASARDLDAASAGIRKMAEVSAHLTASIIALGAGGAMEAGIAARGAATLAGRLAGAIPVVGETARLLKVIDPDHADIYDGVSLAASAGGLASGLASLASGGGQRAALEAVSIATSLAQTTLSAVSVAEGSCQDPATRREIGKLKLVLAALRHATGGVPSLSDVTPP